MPRIITGMLDLRLLGTRLRELWPIEETQMFDDLLRALDERDLSNA